MPEASEAPPELAYQSLYRRFRPQRFSEVRGQDHVTLALRNAVQSDRVSHAYLFSGPRGTGKTSTARILAKALNCATPLEGEPCGVCDSCRAIAAGSSFDVHELDAASNNGVDAMRDLVARASLASPGRSKVYIVDEVHMLSTAASNALLKTLEEPPEHVVFVLATTDPQKVLPTIRSRTQHFEFHLLAEEVLDGLLAEVAAGAELDLPEGALDLARRRAKGSARDALSVLDQVAAAGVVEDDLDAISAIVRALGASDTGAALEALAEAAHAGRDPHQIAIELVERLRVGFLGLVAPRAPGGDGPDAPAAIAEARELGLARCVRAMELIGAAMVAMRDAPEPRITLEVALIRLSHPEVEDSPEAILDRLERLERRLDKLATEGPAAAPALPSAPRPPAPPVSPAAASGVAPPPSEAGGPLPDSTPPAPTEPLPAPASPPLPPLEPKGGRPALGAYAGRGVPASEERVEPVVVATRDGDAPSGGLAAPTRDELVTAWGDHVLLGLRPKVKVIYMAGRFVASEGNAAVFALPNAAHVGRAEPLQREVVEALSAYFGRPVGLTLLIDQGRENPPPTATEGIGETLRPVAGGFGGAGEGEPFPDEEGLAELGSGASEEDPNLGLTWAKDRLLQAFPGAEEVEEG